MKVILICAMGKQREIGEGNALLWDLPADMKHFRARTAGKTVVMGRKTYESIGMLLPKRRNIILSRKKDLDIEGAEVFSDITTMMETLASQGEEEVFIIGGENIYSQFLPLATHCSLTFVDADFAGADAFFPDFSHLSLEKLSETHHASDENHKHGFDICEYGVL